MSEQSESRCPLRQAGALLLLTTVLLATSPAGAQEMSAGDAQYGRLLDHVIAVVGTEVVTRTEMDEALAYEVLLLKARQEAGADPDVVEKEFEKLRTDIRGNLVDNKLILMAAEEAGMQVDDEVAKRLQKLRNGFGDEVKLRQYLGSQGFDSVEDYKIQMKEELLRQRMVFSQVRPKAEVSESEVEAHFVKTHAGETAKEKGCQGALFSYLTLEQVWFPVQQQDTYGALVGAYTIAYRCYLRLAAGDIQIEDVSTECGDESIKPVFGSLGDVDETRSFDRAFQEEFDRLKTLPIGTVSPPIVIQDGMRILRLTAQRYECTDDPSEMARLKDRLKARLAEEKFKKILEWWLKELRGKFRVELRQM